MLRHGLLTAALARKKAEVDPYFGYVVFLSNYEGNANDVKGHAVTLIGNASVSGGALVLDGSGDYARWDRTTEFNFSSVDEFCIDAYVETTAYSSIVGVIALTGLNGGLSFYTHNDGSIAFAVDGNFEVGRSAAGAHPLNTKQHLAVWRLGGRTRAAVNGQIVINVADNNSYVGGTSCSVGGSPGAAGLSINGKVYAARITRFARFGTTNFTPPADPFPEA